MLKSKLICVVLLTQLTNVWLWFGCCSHRKWSRREEADFYRVISSFGVEYNRDEDRYDWTRFRSFGKLERKMDETLTEYFKAFYAMCKRVNGRRLTEEEENLPISVDPISEERASRCLARIDLLSKIREEILTHPELEERLQLCQHSMDLPDWWVCGKHDRDLLVGAAKYGLNRLDFNLANDPELSFVELFKQLDANEEKNMESMETTKTETKTEEICENPKENETDSKQMVIKEENLSESEIKDKPNVKSDDNIDDEEVNTTEKPIEDKSNDKESDDMKTDIKDNNEINSELKEDSKETENEEKDNQIKEEEEDDQKDAKESPEESETLTEEPSKETKVVDNEEEVDEKSAKNESESKEISDKDSEMKDMTNEKTDSDEQKTDTEMEVDSNEKKEELKEEKPVLSETPNESEVQKSETKEEPKEVQIKCEDSEEVKTEEEEEEISKESVNKEVIKEHKMKETEATEEGKQSECEDEKTGKPKDEDMDEKHEKDDKELKSEATDDDKKSISTEDSVTKTEETVEKDMCEVKTESESASILTEKEVSLTSSSTPQPQSTQLKSFPRFPKDRVLQMRLEQICHTVEKNEWPSLRHSFFSLLSGAHPSTPSVATADSSPRPISPCSLSSASREPTPHPTPDHTPRREALSPLPEFFYADNSVSMNESASRRRRRRRRRFEVEAERQKLRNLLSQTIEQSQQSTHSSQQNSSKKQTSLLSGSSSQFLPPLFSLPFCNLRSAIRDELMTDEKTASLLLGSTLQSSLAAAAAASAQQSAAATASSGKSSNSGSSSKGPPPAHQSSSARNPPTMGTLDLTGRFNKSSSKMATPPAPAHKPAPNNPPEMQKVGAQDVLDLSSAPSKGRTRGSSPSKASKSMANCETTSSAASASALPTKKSSKRIGSRIDALALNLQAKKMMEEKKTDPKPSDKLESSLSSLEKRQASHFMEELQKHSALLQNQNKTPPAAHSKSSSSTSKLNDSLMSGKTNAHFSALDASKLPPSKATEASTIAEQVAIIRQNLRNLFEDHPEFIAQNPSMASMVAASAANVFNPNLNMNSISSIPANVSPLH